MVPDTFFCPEDSDAMGIIIIVDGRRAIPWRERMAA
jgi:hypothetical protein